MAIKTDYFVPQDLDTLISTCKHMFSLGEIGSILAFPYSGIEQRIEHIARDYADRFDAPLILIKMSPHIEDFSDIASVLRTAGHSKTDKVNIVISQNEYPLSSIPPSLYADIYRANQSSSHQNYLCIFHQNIAHAPHGAYIASTQYLSNIFQYPLLSVNDANGFVRHMAHEWNIRIRKKQVDMIARWCGGNMWLLKHGVRIRRDTGSVSQEILSSDPGMRYRLRRIVDLWDADEVHTLTTQRPDNSDIAIHDYFSALGLVQKNKITIPLLERYLDTTQQLDPITCRSGSLYVNASCIDAMFSPQEKRVLIQLITYKGKPVTRERLGEILWHDAIDEKYSPWALEQVIRRLRKKLESIGYKKNIILTIRNVGYQYEY